MDKNAIKKYAVWARRELIKKVSQKAMQYEIEDGKEQNANATSANGRLLTDTEKKQRTALVKKIQESGYEQVMEEVAYTWFNRIAALRFMEVNGYLPSHVRVFTNEEGVFQPQILSEAIHLELDGLDMEKVYVLKNANQNEELYKYLLITQCNALNGILPGMFQKIADYTELLLPDNLLREGSVIEQMVSQIPEEDWTDQVQIIGWLYQYYNSEKKDDVFAALKNNVKITKENIPAATQLFTPDWIVRYMVENSLGRLWVEGHPNAELQAQWKYYLEEAKQEPEVEAQLAEIRKEYANLTPEQIKCIDPCMGSGHILAYLFDVLVQIYEAYGFSGREAAASIVEHNLYGLDIDDRAAQLAYFTVMMKARQYDRRFFSRDIQPHVYAIAESNHVEQMALDTFCNGDESLKSAMDMIVAELYDAKEYGSILTVTEQDWAALYARFDEIKKNIGMFHDAVMSEVLPLVQVAEALALKYDVVVTNPPYMGGSGMSTKLSELVKKNYPDSKSDLFAVFIEKCGQIAKKNGYQAMITQHAWMFLSSFEKLRTKMLNTDIVNMAHLGARAFEEIGGEVVQTTSFVIRSGHIAGYKGEYCRLIEPTTQQGKENMFFVGQNRYISDQSNFSKIPGRPIAYWVSEKFIDVFTNAKLSQVASVQEGLKTADNDRFIRFWHEIGIDKSNLISHSVGCKWIWHTKGGQFRRWYGNNDSVLNYEQNGYELRNFKKASLTGTDNYFKECISWTRISTGSASFRYTPEGSIPNMAGLCLYCDNTLYYTALLNSSVIRKCLEIMNPTINYPPGTIATLPIKYSQGKRNEVQAIAKECIDISKTDWDSFETSWNFLRHPLIAVIPRNRMLFDDIGNINLAECYMCWEKECEERFNQLKANEEELNRIFIDIYGLQDELTPDVDDKDVTVRKADLGRDVRSLLSYAVGCMFGRYSLNIEGLAYAGGKWDPSKYASFPADPDNIIPICDDEYFEDDIVGRFVKFIETVYGKKSLETNLEFIANALGGKGQPREVIRNYFLNDFYKDHCKVYQKRPIYWLFDSGKKNGFKCLIYMHRYQPDTIARIRTDYVHEQQARYRTAIVDLENRVANASTGERVKLSKRLKTLNDQAAEIHAYEEKIHHLADQMISIDLDDGVKHNYAIFQDVLAKIK